MLLGGTAQVESQGAIWAAPVQVRIQQWLEAAKEETFSQEVLELVRVLGAAHSP